MNSTESLIRTLPDEPTGFLTPKAVNGLRHPLGCRTAAQYTTNP
jgi:hypothetical protein